MRKDSATRGVNPLHDLPPARERRFAMHTRHLGIESRGGVWRIGPFGNDKTHSALRAPSVVGRRVFARHPTWRARPRHRSHDDPVRQLDTQNLVRREEHLRGTCDHDERRGRKGGLYYSTSKVAGFRSCGRHEGLSSNLEPV